MRTLAWMARNTRWLKRPISTEVTLRRRIIVAERGADGVEGALGDTAFDETVVVAEAATDSLTELTLRLAAHIESSDRRNRAFSSATFVLGRGADVQAVAARELVARTLLTHLTTAGGGELVLLASQASASERDEFILLVEKLLTDLESRSVSIRLQFRSDGVRASSAQGSTSRVCHLSVS
jgi:hypothetical protein